jgi:hypothetical protein
MEENKKSSNELNAALSENVLDTVTGGTDPFDRTQYRSLCLNCKEDSGWVTGLEAIEEWEFEHEKFSGGQCWEFSRIS